jgi:hypothetical protein
VEPRGGARARQHRPRRGPPPPCSALPRPEGATHPTDFAGRYGVRPQLRAAPPSPRSREPGVKVRTERSTWNPTTGKWEKKKVRAPFGARLLLPLPRAASMEEEVGWPAPGRDPTRVIRARDEEGGHRVGRERSSGRGGDRDRCAERRRQPEGAGAAGSGAGSAAPNPAGTVTHPDSKKKEISREV